MREQLSSEESVDAISKGLAASPTRRDVLRLLGSVAVGGLLGLFGAKKADAAVVDACPSCGTCKSCNFDAEGCTNTCSQACLTASLCNEAHSNQKYLQLKQYLLDQGFRQRFDPTSYETSGQAIVPSKILNTQLVKSRVLTFRKPHYLDQVAYLRFVKTSGGNVVSHVEINQFKSVIAVLGVSDANVIEHFPNPDGAPPPNSQSDTASKASLVNECEAVFRLLCSEAAEGALIAAVCGPSLPVTPLFAACMLTLKVALTRPNGINQACSAVAESFCTCTESGIQFQPRCGDVCCGGFDTCCANGVCGHPWTCCPEGTKKCGNGCCPDRPDVVCDPNSTTILGRCRSECPPGSTNCGRNCCGSGQICVNATTGTCGCPVTQATCGSFCCPPGKICTNPTLGTCGCPANQVSCGNTCCPSGQVCNGTTCVTSCPPGKVACGGNCCNVGTQCCSGWGLCIPDTQVCCPHFPGANSGPSCSFGTKCCLQPDRSGYYCIPNNATCPTQFASAGVRNSAVTTAVV